MLRSLVGISCGVSVLLAASASRAQCTKDTDCKGDRVCNEGTCTAPAAPAPTPRGAEAGDASAPAASDIPAARPAQPAAAEPEMPAEPPREEPKRRRHSTGMMVGGIVMVSFVPVALIAAAVANNRQSACEAGGVSFELDEGFRTYDGVDCSTYDKTIYGGLISAVVLAGVGIPLIVIGGKKEPAPATATITPWATPRAAGLGLRVDL